VLALEPLRLAMEEAAAELNRATREAHVAVVEARKAEAGSARRSPTLTAARGRIGCEPRKRGG
jgi:hypothetical protein